MIKFIFKMPVRRRARFFCMATRGCFHIGRVPIPGAAGLANFLPMLVMLMKGYNIRGALSIDMPVNFTSFSPPPTHHGIEKIIRQGKDKAHHAFGKLFAGRHLLFTLNNLWELCWSIPLLVFFPIFPIAYLLVGRFLMGKIMFACTACAGCGLCAASCACGAIAMKGMKKPRPFWRYNCEDCLRCLNYCPHGAVQAGHL